MILKNYKIADDSILQDFPERALFLGFVLGGVVGFCVGFGCAALLIILSVR